MRKQQRAAQRENPYALIAFGNLLTPEGPLHSEKILTFLLKHKIWYLPRHTTILVPEMPILFYQSERGIVAHAFVRSVEPLVGIVHICGKPFNFFTRKITLKEPKIFRVPVQLGPLATHLDMVGNHKYWGHSVRSTPRRISKHDYNELLSLGLKRGLRTGDKDDASS